MNYPGATLDGLHVDDYSSQQPSPISSPTNYNTLDEPVLTTLKRDLYQIFYKAKFVMLPYKDSNIQELRNWDLWGPLVFCMALAITLAISAPENQKASVFAAVFVVVWLGSALVTLNGILLRGKISFLQTVCVFGYCLFPLNIASALALAWNNFIFQAIMAILATIWASKAAVGFMSQLVPENRKLLAVYPVI